MSKCCFQFLGGSRYLAHSNRPVRLPVLTAHQLKPWALKSISFTIVLDSPRVPAAPSYALPFRSTPLHSALTFRVFTAFDIFVSQHPL